jgi:uncharacterized protein YjiS (DUF1127 family)
MSFIPQIPLERGRDVALAQHLQRSREQNALARLVGLIGLWSGRSRQRRALGDLDARLLADVGVSRRVAQSEAKKWFWQ